jgi:hypothetical protein
MSRERAFLLPGTVVRHVRHPNKWGILIAAPDGGICAVRWRGGEEQRVPWTLLIRAAAPCRVCGQRADADAHTTAYGHTFIKENY